MIFGNFMTLSICTQLCSHTACSLLVILQGALQKQSFFYAIFNSQNNIGSMRRYSELMTPGNVRLSHQSDWSLLTCRQVVRTLSLGWKWVILYSENYPALRALRLVLAGGGDPVISAKMSCMQQNWPTCKRSQLTWMVMRTQLLIKTDHPHSD